MRVGSFVFATDQGLGYLAKDFYDNGVITDVMVIRHGRRRDHTEWYPKAQYIGDLHSEACVTTMREFVLSMDRMLYFETPFRWDMMRLKKCALMPMYECMPEALPRTPDLFICPSLLDWTYYPPDVVNSVFLPVPVKRTWTPRGKITTFVHNSGNGGLRGRNGTAELLHAWKFVKSPARLIVRSQEGTQYSQDPRVVFEGPVAADALYSTGEVFIFPEKFNGLSLPLQEAHASGMVVMCGARFPMTSWLPNEPMIPVRKYSRQRVSGRCLEYNEAEYNPQDIVNTVDAWYGRDARELSISGREWAEQMSWEVLKPKYLYELERM